MSEKLTLNSVVEAYGREFVPANIPEATIAVALLRMARHGLGNEVASRVKAWREAFKTANGSEPSDAQESAKQNEFRDEYWNKFTTGEIGIRAPGETVDPVEAEMERIAKQEVLDTLKANGYAWVYPKDEAGKRVKGGVATVTVPGLDGPQTLESLVERRLGKHGERIRTAAEKAIKAKAKRLDTLKGQVDL